MSNTTEFFRNPILGEFFVHLFDFFQVEVSSPNAESENTLTNCTANDATNSNTPSSPSEVENNSNNVEDSKAPTTTQSSKSEPSPPCSSNSSCSSRTNEIKDESGN